SSMHKALYFLMCLLTFIMATCTYGQESPSRALLITGGGWHGYEVQETMLVEGINERLGDQIEWTIIHEGGGAPDHQVSILTQENWAADYDVVVHNTGFARVRDPDFVAQFVNQHKGIPAVLIHAAIQSYRYAEPADPWFAFMGYQSMLSEDERQLEIENTAPEHPIMKSIPESFSIPGEEVYISEKIWDDITLLAQTYGKET